MKKLVIGFISLLLLVGCSSGGKEEKVYYSYGEHGYGEMELSLELEKKEDADVVVYKNDETLAELQMVIVSYRIEFELIRLVYQTNLESVADTWDIEIKEVTLGGYPAVRLSGFEKGEDNTATRWIFQDEVGLTHIILFKGTKAEAELVFEELEASFQLDPFSELESSSKIKLSITEELKYVGEVDKGFVMIPESWVEFIDVAGNSDLQYSDALGMSIITMNLVELGGMEADVETVAVAIYTNIAQDKSATMVTKEPEAIEVNQLSGYRFSSYYASLGKVLTVYILEREDGQFQYIAVEGYPYMISELRQLIETTYSEVNPE